MRGPILTCVVPLILVLGGTAYIFIGLQYMHAPSADTIYAYARKCVLRDEETVKSALRHRLVRRYSRRHMNRPPVEYGCLFGFGPLLVLHFIVDIRNWISDSIVESRIDRAIERLWRE